MRMTAPTPKPCHLLLETSAAENDDAPNEVQDNSSDGGDEVGMP
jgi:hypothetical protein